MFSTSIVHSQIVIGYIRFLLISLRMMIRCDCWTYWRKCCLIFSNFSLNFISPVFFFFIIYLNFDCTQFTWFFLFTRIFLFFQIFLFMSQTFSLRFMSFSFVFTLIPRKQSHGSDKLKEIKTENKNVKKK